MKTPRSNTRFQTIGLLLLILLIIPEA